MPIRILEPPPAQPQARGAGGSRRVRVIEAPPGGASGRAPVRPGQNRAGGEVRRPGVWEDAARGYWAGALQSAAALGNLVQGLAIPGGSGDLDALGGYLVRRGAHLIGITTPEQDQAWEASNTAARRAAGHLTTAETLTTPVWNSMGANYRPETGVGQIANTLGQFSVNAIVPGGPVARVASVVVPTATTELAGEGRRAAGGNPQQVAAARAAGGIVGGFLVPGGAPRGLVTVTENSLAPVVRSFEQAGVDPMLAATQGRGAASATNMVAENMLAGARVRPALRARVNQAASSAERISGGYGDARGPQITGENIQSGVQRFANDGSQPAAGRPTQQSSFSARANEIYDDAFSVVERAEATAVERAQESAQMTRQAVEQETLARTGGATSVPERPAPGATPAPVVSAPATQDALREISGRVNSQSIADLIEDPRIATIARALSSDASNVRFADLRALRTWVRRARSEPELRQGIAEADLQRLEQSLTSDIYANAENLAGPQAARNLRRADQFYAAGQARIKDALQPFANARSGESAYARVVQAAGSTSSADAQSLLALKRSLHPDEWGDVVAQVVSNLGRPTASAADQGGFSFSRFVTNYNTLSPRGRAILFGSVGGGGRNAARLQAELDNLAEVVQRLLSVERGANASNSGTAVQNVLTTLGFIGSGGLAFKGVIGMGMLGEAMTNPAFVRWLANVPRYQRSPTTWTEHLSRLEALGRASPAIAQIQKQIQANEPPSMMRAPPNRESVAGQP